MDKLEMMLNTVPSEKQIKMQETEYYNFLHLSLNTFNNCEWGDGTEPLSQWTIKDIDTDKWISDLKSTGSRGVIITAKHHSGFCLFPSEYTDYCIKNTVYREGKGDIVKQLQLSCAKYGLKFGVYLSPWDRHEESYGTDAYNDYFCNQLTELCTNYGELFCLWFDGACGEGPNGKKQIYDWDRYFSLINSLQPNACLSICGRDVRWIGNEGGHARKSEWSVVPARLSEQDSIMEASQQDVNQNLQKINTMDSDIGSRKLLMNESNYIWYPAEMDISITSKGWFYRKSFEKFHTRSVKNLVRCYCDSVGNNAMLLVNIPPNTEGILPAKFINRLVGMKNTIANMFADKINVKAEIVDENTFRFNTGGQKVAKVVIKEDITKSHRIEDFDIIIDGKKVFNGGAVGYKKYCIFRARKAQEVIIKVNSKRGELYVKDIEIYS